MWRLDLAYADEPAKKIKCVMCLLVRRNVFDKTVDANGMKTKDANKTVRAFLKMITKN